MQSIPQKWKPESGTVSCLILHTSHKAALWMVKKCKGESSLLIILEGAICTSQEFHKPNSRIQQYLSQPGSHFDGGIPTYTFQANSDIYRC